MSGYGRNFNNWDSYMESLHPRPDDVYLQNWCPFLSAKGEWMAFYNSDYHDIRIVRLEDMSVVIDRFYTNAEENVFFGHVNFSTYVPSYFKTLKDGETVYIVDNDGDEKFPNEYFDYALAEGSKLQSVPYAFNAWTIWAADTEFYVDVLDLTEVDNGIVGVTTVKPLTIPIRAAHVRDYVDVRVDRLFDMVTREWKDDAVRFSYLEERSFGDQLVAGNLVNDENDARHTVKPMLPWEEIRERIGRLG